MINLKLETLASTRCIPKNVPIAIKGDKCFYTGKKTKRVVIFAKAY